MMKQIYRCKITRLQDYKKALTAKGAKKFLVGQTFLSANIYPSPIVHHGGHGSRGGNNRMNSTST